MSAGDNSSHRSLVLGLLKERHASILYPCASVSHLLLKSSSKRRRRERRDFSGAVIGVIGDNSEDEAKEGE
jgi:hypothetical protein